MKIIQTNVVTTYFSKVHKLPSDIVPISIAQYQPMGFNLETSPVFVPNDFCRDLFRQGDWQGYRREFRELYNNERTKQIFIKYLQENRYEKVALVCWEKDFNKCHRSFAAEILNDFKIFDNKVEEFLVKS